MAEEKDSAGGAGGEAKADGEEKPKLLRTRRVGNSGLRVSELGLGAMTFGAAEKNTWGMSVAHEEDSFAIMNAFRDAGGNFIDTADIYGHGDSERVVGKWINAGPHRRDDLVVATKLKNRMGPGVNDVGLSRKHIMESIERSLERLGTHYVDIYQLHANDPETPVEETFSALNDLVRAGKVHYIGFSNMHAWHMARAMEVCERYGFAKPISLQPQHSLLARSVEWDLLPCCKDYGLGSFPWSPLAGGWLSGRYTRDMAGPEAGSRVSWAQGVGWKPTNWEAMAVDHTWNVLDEVRAVAGEVGATPAQVSLRWVMQTPGVTAPIIGARKMEHLEDNLKAAHITLSDEQMARLNSVSDKPKPYPWGMTWGEKREMGYVR